MSSHHEVSLVDKLKNTMQGRRRFAQERSIVRVTEQLEEAMNLRRVNRSDLAKLLGRSKGWVTQLLDGENNKTIRTLADAFAVLDAEFETGFKMVASANAATEEETLRFSFELNVPIEFEGGEGSLKSWNIGRSIEGVRKKYASSAIGEVGDGS